MSLKPLQPISLRLSPTDEVEYRTRYNSAAALRADAVARGDQVAAKRFRQAISALYTKYEGLQLPEPTMKPEVPEPIATPLPPSLNTDHRVAVSNEVYWIEDMSICPRGYKVQLLGAGGVAVYGIYDGKDPFWIGWQDTPRRRKS